MHNLLNNYKLFHVGEEIMGKMKTEEKPWLFLEQHRGIDFNGEWPTIVEMFEISAKRFPDNPCFSAFVPQEEAFNYTEARQIIRECAAYLIKDGVKKGDKIALSGKNSPEWAMAYLAILYAGAIVEPIDITYHDVEMETLLKFGDATRIFIDADRIKGIDEDGKVGFVAKYSLEPLADKSYPFILDMKAEVGDVYHADIEDVAAILFTSGTTGTPKGVMLTHHNMVSDCFLVTQYMPLSPSDVFYAILPIHHAYTMLAVFLETFSVGASCVFGKRLVVSQLLKELREGKVTMFLAVPMLFNKIIASLMAGVRKKGILLYGIVRMMMGFSGFVKKVFHKNIGKKLFGFLLKQVSLDTNRVCICGGGPLPSSTFRMFNELGIDFVQGYGLTETSPITHLNPVSAYIETSVGKRFAEEEVKIINPDSDGNGIICIKGPMVMKGYYKNQAATDEILDKDGWLNTGDVGHQDENGYLYLTGREKNIIVTEGGKNVFPEEIEDHFQLYDDIETICIIGYIIDVKQASEGIRAIVYPSDACRRNFKDNREGLESHINSIIADVNKELQSYKKITKVTVSNEPLPMTSTKKVKRFEVAKLFKDK